MGLLSYGPLLRCPSLIHRSYLLHTTRLCYIKPHDYDRHVLDDACCHPYDVSSAIPTYMPYTDSRSVEFVKARDVFNNNGMPASVGSYAFGFTWAATVCLFIASTLFFGGCLTGRTSDGTRDKGFFRRNRSTRSRGSFIDNESQRRVIKEESY
jgi:hypothetical protein